ncbi:hypothetical protein HYC85_015139 [Camellia sinensis]|uniref:Apple domain-containing protein n=1 Tax=Camellia sinensis TaxID=4442 RepID=A0A7J7H8B6_CAMSI|nr:hypothetical protein HYC85_015139 [Camellia sinensis]
MQRFGSHLITQLTPYLLAGLCFLARSSPPAHPHRTRLKNGSFSRQKIPLALSSSQFMRLDPDGHLKVYESGELNFNAEVVDLLTSGIGDCGYPMVCSNYGICSSDGQCACPYDANSETSTFRQISYRQPNLGCSLVTPISCSHSQYHTLLELKNTSYFNFNLIYTYKNSFLDEKIDLEDCKKSCLKNCSCKAVFFAYHLDYDSRKGCLLLSEKSSTAPTNSPSKKSRQVTIMLGSSLGTFFGVFFLVICCFFLPTKKQESK